MNFHLHHNQQADFVKTYCINKRKLLEIQNRRFLRISYNQPELNHRLSHIDKPTRHTSLMYQQNKER